MIEFVVRGNPVAQSRPRATRVGNSVRLYDESKTRDFKSYFKFSAALAMRGRQIYDIPLRVTLDVFVAKPKSWPKKRVHADTKPDLDNFAKAALDAMEGVVYTNDSRIVELQLAKHLSDFPRCEVKVEPALPLEQSVVDPVDNCLDL